MILKKFKLNLKKVLPTGKDADELAKDLATVEVDNIGKYLVRSFQTFRNPEYVPDEKIMDGAVSYLVNNVIKKTWLHLEHLQGMLFLNLMQKKLTSSLLKCM